ncbi:MAG: hypothetical protein JW839_04560 [Candidatus Lokiarchaeota archaeon]|nr:hypothetical protein [Candidatus Lokiarchaeota archaeon]
MLLGKKNRLVIETDAPRDQPLPRVKRIKAFPDILRILPGGTAYNQQDNVIVFNTPPSEQALQITFIPKAQPGQYKISIEVETVDKACYSTGWNQIEVVDGGSTEGGDADRNLARVEGDFTEVIKKLREELGIGKIHEDHKYIIEDVQGIRESIINVMGFLDRLAGSLKRQESQMDSLSEDLEAGQVGLQHYIDDFWDVMAANAQEILEISKERLGSLATKISGIIVDQGISNAGISSILELENEVNSYARAINGRLKDLIVKSKKHFSDTEQQAQYTAEIINYIKKIDFSTAKTQLTAEALGDRLNQLIELNRETIKQRLVQIQQDPAEMDRIEERLDGAPAARASLGQEVEKSLSKVDEKKEGKLHKSLSKLRKGINAYTIVNGLLGLVSLFTPGLSLSIGGLVASLFKLVF